MIKKLSTALLLSGSLYAGSISFDLENDVFFANDLGYTNGTKISFEGKPHVKGALKYLLPYEPQNNQYSIFQFIYTPDDLKATEPLPEDRPYAGVLGFEFLTETVSEDKSHYYATGFQLGVRGPSSYAEETQTAVHELIGATIPKGWDNQLPDAPHVNCFYIIKQRLLRTPVSDIVSGVSVSLGSNTQADANVLLRLGYNLPDYFELVNAPVPMFNSKWSAYLFAGGSATGVLYNATLDAPESTVNSENFVMTSRGGAAVGFDKYEVKFTAIYRTKEYEEEDKPSVYGVLSF